MDWQSDWDNDPISYEDFLHMTAHIYQWYKQVLDTMPENALDVLKSYVEKSPLSQKDNAILNQMSVVDDVEMGKGSLLWLFLDIPEEP